MLRIISHIKMQIKNHNAIAYIPLRMAELLRDTYYQTSVRMRNNRHFTHFWEVCNMAHHSGNNLAFSYKVNILLPYDIMISFWGVYLREMKTHVHTQTHS